ncbi:MAG TPA: ATP-binding cassette domain-containing protein [Pyrinomonadaceae bacterium]|nr:ATP-binding cassette domain-containing protein [Pyrinomonadaceae bacterium]
MNSSPTNNRFPAIEFRHVSYSYENRPALKDITFRLEQGEMLFITGESGSGKSTILRLAIGLLRPDEGQILINGREIETLSEDELLVLRGGSMGMIFQEDALFTGLTVYDNVAYRPREHGRKDEDTDRAVMEVLRFVGLAEDLEKYPEELSGGMKRRLEIARALVDWPEIMLYDEPTYSLDPLTALQIMDLAIRARDIHKISSIYVTKELHEIPYLATHYAAEDDKGLVTVRAARAPEFLPQRRVILLEDGEIVWTGSTAEFQASALPEVTHMTHPAAGVRRVKSYFSDPWSRSRRPKEQIL